MNQLSFQGMIAVTFLILYSLSVDSPRILSQNAGGTPGVSPPTNSASAAVSDARPRLYQDLFEHNFDSENRIFCQTVLPKDPQFECETRVPLYSLDDLPGNVLGTSLKRKGQSDYSAILTVEEIRDPQVLKKMVDGCMWQQALDPQFVEKIYKVEAGDDYVVSLSEQRFSKTFQVVGRAINRGRSVEAVFAADLQRAHRLLNYVHGQGSVAISFLFEPNQTPNQKEDMKLARLCCATKVGEAVGKCVFDPLYTDPLVLDGDGNVKADLAMDSYALGIHVVQLINSVAASKNLKLSINLKEKIMQMKSEGKFEFKKDTHIVLGFLAAFLLQNDRRARTDEKMLTNIISLTQLAPPPLLKEQLVIDTSMDPLKVPEFQELLKEISSRTKGSMVVDKNDDEDLDDGWLWAWKWWIAGGIAAFAVFILVYLWTRSNAPGDRQQTEVQTHLDGEQPDQPVVLAGTE
jgi:hypothetical protein